MPTSGGYDPHFFDLLDAVEDRHFWFKARSRIIAAFAHQLTHQLPPGHRVLELGCGNGGMLGVLSRACPTAQVVGMDLYGEGLQHARRRSGAALVQGDVHHPPFSTRFDLVGLFDVLEHIPDDLTVLRDIFALLAPGGALLITVPAHPHLWSYFDTASKHCRRYRSSELREKLKQTGFDVEYLSPFMGPIYPLVWIARRLQTLRAQKDERTLAADELRIIPGVNGILNAMLALESPLIKRHWRMLLGTSLVAIARRKTAS